MGTAGIPLAKGESLVSTFDIDQIPPPEPDDAGPGSIPDPDNPDLRIPTDPDGPDRPADPGDRA